ncbi:uncharacterized protein LOC121202266 isoform X2 [Betta splendens]|uniref:Uncharacterized protein LOC121202266 isoform X2 n=1 Tax=Betta splendens TaxID=158456 RepID=A0A9W2XSP3_BETSP|nr:uncharacterized protein LOC121202266 isoform X2 [Betta splendens]XP_055365026.1 uncharacterized protein LOC121202266 isoform X2 [Betta splendens]
MCSSHIHGFIMIQQLLLIVLIPVPPPELTVTPVEIAETDAVTLNCRTPSSASLCFFYTVSGRTVRTFSCLWTLTGAELLHMASLRPPAEVEVKCYYTRKGRSSPHSDPSSITIKSSPQPKLTVTPVKIAETNSVTLNCQTPSSVSQCFFVTVSGGTVRSLSCLWTLTGTELLHMAQLRSPAEVEVQCYYTFNGRNSPLSDPSSITIQSRRPSTNVIDTDTESSVITTSPKTPVTTGLTLILARTSAPVARLEPTSGETTAGHTFDTKALTSVKQAADLDISTTSMKAEFEEKKKAEWMWRVIIGVAACGVASGVVLLLPIVPRLLRRAGSPAGAEAVEEDKVEAVLKMKTMNFTIYTPSSLRIQLHPS